MNRKSMDNRLSLLLLLGFALSAPLQLQAQVPLDESGQPLAALDDERYADEPGQDMPTMTTVELEDLVGPVALYPDDLLAIVLPASTYPLEIVQAVRFLDEFEADKSLEPDESWDESVVALLNYPEVIRMLDKEIDWTWRLGEAVIAQQADVIAAVESFRDRAYAAGNLESDEYQTVSKDDGVIEIVPIDEEIIYVPYYEPEEVVVYQPRRVYNYYPNAYPVYNYPYPVGYNFYSGYFWGVTTAYTIGWSDHYLNVYHPSYWGHPYYGRSYYGHYYRRPSISVYNSWYGHNNYQSSTYRQRDGDHWRPRYRRSGARPATQSVRNNHYPSGTYDRNRGDSRSSGRTRRDGYDTNRISADRIRPSSSGNDRRTRITANNGRGIGASDANRRSSGRTGTRDRTGVSNPNPTRIERGGSRNNAASSGSAIRFRDRAAANTVRADRSGNSRRNNGASSDRQRVTAQNSRRATTGTRISQNRVTSQRSTPRRQSTTTRTSSHSGATQRPPSQRSLSQRPATRAVQRQAPTRRSSSRPPVQRQVSAQRSEHAASAQRQQAPRQAAPSSNHGQSGSKPQRRESASRGHSRRSRQH